MLDVILISGLRQNEIVYIFAEGFDQSRCQDVLASSAADDRLCPAHLMADSLVQHDRVCHQLACLFLNIENMRNGQTGSRDYIASGLAICSGGGLGEGS